MLLGPLQPLNHVLQSVVHAPVQDDLPAVEKAEGPNAVVDLHHDDVSKVGNVAAVEIGVGVGIEAAALDEVHDRKPRVDGGVGRREDVGKETIFSHGEPLAWFVGKVRL